MVWLNKRSWLLVLALPFVILLGVMSCGMGVFAADPPVITEGTYHFSFTAWEANSPDTKMYLRFYDYDYTTPYQVYAYKSYNGNMFAVYFCMFNEKREFMNIVGSDGVVINRALYKVFQPHNKDSLISESYYTFDYTPGRGILNGVSSIFSDSDFSVSCPLFESFASLKNYIATGDTSGMISEGERQDVRDTAIDSVLGFYGFQHDTTSGGGFSFSWDGLASFVGAVPQMVEVDPEDFVDVYFGLASLETGEHVTEKSLCDLGPYSQPMVSYMGAHYNSVLRDAVGDGNYVEYVRFTPYHYGADLLNPDFKRLFKCRDSVAYFDSYGNFVSYDGAAGYLPPSDPPEVADDDYFLEDFDTGIDFVDFILNGFVRFVNAILKAIYNIRDLIFGRGSKTGFYQLVQSLVYYMNPINLFKELNRRMWDGFGIVMETLFVPDMDKISARIEELAKNFGWAQLVFGFIEKLFNLIMSSAGAAPPSITVDFSNYEGYFAYGRAAVVIDFAWYARYKPYVDTIISCFVWVGFLWHLFQRLPEIIRGGGMVVDYSAKISDRLNVDDVDRAFEKDMA